MEVTNWDVMREVQVRTWGAHDIHEHTLWGVFTKTYAVHRFRHEVRDADEVELLFDKPSQTSGLLHATLSAVKWGTSISLSSRQTTNLLLWRSTHQSLNAYSYSLSYGRSVVAYHQRTAQCLAASCAISHRTTRNTLWFSRRALRTTFQRLNGRRGQTDTPTWKW